MLFHILFIHSFNYGVSIQDNLLDDYYLLINCLYCSEGENFVLRKVRESEKISLIGSTWLMPVYF